MPDNEEPSLSLPSFGGLFGKKKRQEEPVQPESQPDSQPESPSESQPESPSESQPAAPAEAAEPAAQPAVEQTPEPPTNPEPTQPTVDPAGTGAAETTEGSSAAVAGSRRMSLKERFAQRYGGDDAAQGEQPAAAPAEPEAPTATAAAPEAPATPVADPATTEATSEFAPRHVAQPPREEAAEPDPLSDPLPPQGAAGAGASGGTDAGFDTASPRGSAGSTTEPPAAGPTTEPPAAGPTTEPPATGPTTEHRAAGSTTEHAPVQLTLPQFGGMAASIVTGLVVGVLGSLLTWLALSLCEFVRGTSTCGRPGFVLILIILAGLVAIGSLLLRLWRVPDPTSTSLLAVALLVVVALLAVDVLLTWWMGLLFPVLAIVAFAGSYWLTVTVISPEKDAPPAV